MHPYTAADTLRIAKRYNNPKRSYLLVNPLQAKHIPVSPRRRCFFPSYHRFFGGAI